MTTETDDRDVWLELPGTPAIEGLRLRRHRRDDADWIAMADVTRAANLADDIPYLPTIANLREELQDSDAIDLGTDLVLVEVDGVLIADAGVERVIRGGHPVYEVWGHVHPDWRRRGLGRALLAANLRRAAERAAGDPEAMTPHAAAYVDERQADHRRLVEGAGFEVVRWFFLMRRPTLDAIPEADLPDGLEFRPVTPDQHRAIWDAEAEAFRDHWQSREQTENDFEATFRREELDTSLWVVAWDGDQVAGVVQTWIWTGENRELGLARGWLEHISVRRPWRRRGLGRAITAEALRRLQAAGMTEAMLGVDAENETGALGLYEGLGFEVHQRTTAYRLPLPRR